MTRFKPTDWMQKHRIAWWTGRPHKTPDVGSWVRKGGQK